MNPVRRRPSILPTALLLALCPSAGIPAPAASEPAAPPEPRAVRVILLDRLEPAKAKQEIMSEGVRRFSMVAEGRVVILSDSPERIEGFVDLVRQLDPAVRVVEPHPPFTLPPDGEPTEERIFFVREEADLIVSVRTLYGIRSIEPLASGLGVAVRAAPAVLDAAEATLRAAGLLGEAAPKPAP